MKTELLFVNPFAVDSRLTHPQIDDRLAEVEHGFAAYIKTKLGQEAMEAYFALVNAITTDMANPEDVITDEFFKKEITGAWQDLGKARDWLKTQGVTIPLNEAGLESIHSIKEEG